ncbi:MAG: tRNA (adenosine(37)-N6)-dimethylallyltransferase MiaA [Chloroflexi bacterium]|nr:MAG: tRNA (adenosine(37)-N6)-dimethylallyltransferase MiaA [Chloroflexota bacterium]
MWRIYLPGKPLIVILGPTASGKTGLAIEIAQHINGEIIGADSRQVYRYMDIGTAKPTLQQMQAVPHHLIDIIDPDDNLTLARYQQLAYQTIDSIHSRGRIPLLVGGTGQYITAVTEGWSIPQVQPDYLLRAELEAQAQRFGNEYLHQQLMQVDSDAAHKIHPNNIRRVIRALEVYRLTGEKISVLQRKIPPPYRIMELGLQIERQQLYDRADARVDHMITAGFLAEVENLLKRGYDRHLPSMSGLGYAQLAAHLLDGLPLEQAIHDTKIATHDFIRRQLTWFRHHDNGILWHNVTHHEKIIQLCSNWVAN